MSGTKQKSIRAEREKKKSVWKNWQLYIMCLPAVIYFLIFAYKPMYGIIIAFKNYSMRKGIMGSPWIGFGNFERLFSSYWFPIILKNTLTLSGLTLILGFPIPILLALILNEVQNSRFRKGFQTISYAPHFISTVVLCGMLTLFLSPSSGVINRFITMLGGEHINFLQEPSMFKWVYVLSGVWQEMGWGSIIYIAAITNIDQGLYDAATIDGAGRWRKMWHITLPGIRETIAIVYIMKIGQMMSLGFEKIILLYNGMTYETADVISTYIYRMGLMQMNYSYSSAVGLFNSVINLVLLVVANKVSKRLFETSMW